MFAFTGCSQDAEGPEQGAQDQTVITEDDAAQKGTAAADLLAAQANEGDNIPVGEESSDIKKANGTDDYAWVDLELPSGTLWASCNLGANSPEEFGEFYAWGEVTPKTPMPAYDPDGNYDTKDLVDWTAYKYCEQKDSTMTKYCLESRFGTVDEINYLESVDDAATAKWGEDWIMPCDSDFQELIKQSDVANGKITRAWATVSGVTGLKFTNTENLQVLFFPAAGYRYKYGHDCKKFAGMYWTNALHVAGTPINDNNARVFYFTYNFCKAGYNARCYGLSIRPIRKK